jgi:hypothetical protein
VLICNRKYSVTEQRELPLGMNGVMLRGNTLHIRQFLLSSDTSICRHNCMRQRLVDVSFVASTR